MDTKKFRTRQEINFKISPKGKHYIIGLDAGYSGMKVYYENGYFCFPSFIKQVSENSLTVPAAEDILYRDLETGELYMVGKTAQQMVSSTDTNDTEEELFTRKRYSQRAFHILCHTAIAMAMKDKKDNREVIIQTGLPTAYVDGDSESLKKALCKNVTFELKIGLGEWKKYQLGIKADCVYIMPQPAGSYYSTIIRSNGQYMPDAKDFLFGNVLVIDIGAGTGDIYGIKSRSIVSKESVNNIGMREVLKNTSKQILEELNEDIHLSALQQNLESGVVVYIDEDEMSTEEKSLSPYLEKASDEVFQKAMEKIKGVTNVFRDYKYIIIGGGTGEAWFEKIQKYLSKMKTLQIVASNRTDSLPFIYSNARGYYLYRVTMDKR